MEEKSKLSTESYKGVRDFYPEDMAIQNYIFDIWRKVAEKFGYSEYSASILEPADLYKHKTSDEIVSRQMFTFKDRGDREVALRPEMTPSLARMIAAKRRGLKFPLRWFSIPNVFRYEQPQRGRKREHWQLNCDIMGIADVSAEVEIISLAHAVMKEFGAQDSDFEIRINDKGAVLKGIREKLQTPEQQKEYFRLEDEKDKIPKEEYDERRKKLLGDTLELEFDTVAMNALMEQLKNKGINVIYDKSLVRGFDYYTGIVFELFDTNPENRRSLLGGGRYDNLLEIFDVEPVPTVGFGMGDVTMRDFLEAHGLKLS